MAIANKEFDLPFGQSGINIPSWQELTPFGGSDKIEITIGVSNWHRDGTIGECIDSLCNQEFPKNNYEIVIVDDCSEDNSREIIRKTIERYPDNIIRYYELEHSRTKNEHHPHNVTIRKALGKIFIKDSGDCLFSKHYLEGTWRHHQRYENLFLHCFWGCVASEFRKADTKKEILIKAIEETKLEEGKLSQYLTAELPAAHAGKHPIDTGGSMLTKHWQQLHGYDEQIQGNIAGDVCLICRCTRIGIVFGYDPTLLMLHEHISSKQLKRGWVGPHTGWEPNDTVKNKSGYGELTATEEQNCVMTSAFKKIG